MTTRKTKATAKAETKVRQAGSMEIGHPTLESKAIQGWGTPDFLLLAG